MRAELLIWVLCILLGDDVPIRIQKNRVSPKNTALHLLFREHQPRLDVRQHEAQPVVGQPRIKRHIGSPGLENAEQSDHHPRSAVEAHRDGDFRSYAALQQVPGQLIGALVQFAIAQLLTSGNYGHGVRRLLSLYFE